MADPVDRAAAFRGAAGAFVLRPPFFDPSPGFPEARQVISAVRTALADAGPARVVGLSTIGAQATEENLLTQLTLMEREIGTLPMPVAFLRPGWFMENSAWDVPAARDGVVPSYLRPLDRPIPMVATADVGRVAAELLRGDRGSPRVIELEGPRRVTPNDIAAAFARALGRPVRTEVLPRETWRDRFVALGMKYPESRMRMLDGFNEGGSTSRGRGGR